MPSEQVRHLAQAGVGSDRDRFARHDFPGGRTAGCMGGGLQFRGADQAGEILDTEIEGLAIAVEQSCEFLFAEVQRHPRSGRRVGAGLELSKRVMAAGQSGIDRGQYHQHDGARRNGCQCKAEPQFLDGARAHRGGHRHGARRRMHRATQDRCGDCQPHRQGDPQRRVGHGQADRHANEGSDAISHHCRPGLCQGAVWHREKQHRCRPERRDQVQA